MLVWQCIGRLLRGRANARVHFIDAKWAPRSAGLRDGQPAAAELRRWKDTPQSSMLLGFEHVLNEALNDPNPQRQALAGALYGPFAEALAQTQGVERDDDIR